MNDDGTFKPMSEMIAFSVGKRQCLGEGLARMELFIFLANVFNHFKVVHCSRLYWTNKC